MPKPYVPDAEQVKQAFISDMTNPATYVIPEQDMLTHVEAEAWFDRFMATVRATALREAQAIFEKSHPTQWGSGMVSCVLGARAAKFEQEASNG